MDEEFLQTVAPGGVVSPPKAGLLPGKGTQIVARKLLQPLLHRGLSVERGETEVGSKGRAVHRKDSSATGPSSLHSGSAASEPVVVEQLAHRVMLHFSSMGLISELELCI